MNTTDFDKAQGHWILARMGKRVLRPGGKELTYKLIDSLNITRQDHIAEFAPGLGFTATLALKHAPASYIGIDSDEKAVRYLKQKVAGNNIRFIQGNAADTQLPESCTDKVFGEAMLTMHTDHRKSEIIREAHRILKKGGLYAIHELGLTPGHLDAAVKTAIQKDLAMTIRVNARPLTEAEWTALLEKEGFRVLKTEQSSMHLLEPARMIDDEGVFGALKIGFNILIHPKAGKRILEMRKTFKKHQQHLHAIAIVSEKI